MLKSETLSLGAYNINRLISYKNPFIASTPLLFHWGNSIWVQAPNIMFGYYAVPGHPASVIIT